MKIGVLYCSYSTPHHLLGSFGASWKVARRDKWGGHEFVVSAVSLPFAEYNGYPEDDRTPDVLKWYLDNQMLDYLTTEPKYVSEAAARTLALRPLLAAGCDLIWIADGDEYYTEEQVVKIASFVEQNPFINWFRLSFKNRVFTSSQYLAEPFTPPRIFRTSISGGYTLDKFSWDNDLVYVDTQGHEKAHMVLPSMAVPPFIAWIEHKTWLNDTYSKAKIEYQLKHFGAGNCSYAWDDSQGGLIFNKAYFTSHKLTFPEVLSE